MVRNSFTEGRLELFERMMQSVPRQVKAYKPPMQQRKNYKQYKRKYSKQK